MQVDRNTSRGGMAAAIKTHQFQRKDFEIDHSDAHICAVYI